MKILAIETTGKYASAALADAAGMIYSARSHEPNDHLRELIGTIDKTLCEAGCDKSELTHVAASVGPGSFTGIRIGVTAARMFSQSLDIPCISVSSLKGLALRALEDAQMKGCNVLAAIINARRHQVYASAWGMSGGALFTLIEEKQYMIEEFIEKLKIFGRIYFTGDGADSYEDIIAESDLRGRFELSPVDLRYQHASTIAALALIKADAKETVAYSDLIPEYMRLAEAEQRLREGTLSDKIKELTIRNNGNE